MKTTGRWCTTSRNALALCLFGLWRLRHFWRSSFVQYESVRSNFRCSGATVGIIYYASNSYNECVDGIIRCSERSGWLGQSITSRTSFKTTIFFDIWDLEVPGSVVNHSSAFSELVWFGRDALERIEHHPEGTGRSNIQVQNVHAAQRAEHVHFVPWEKVGMSFVRCAHALATVQAVDKVDARAIWRHFQLIMTRWSRKNRKKCFISQDQNVFWTPSLEISLSGRYKTLRVDFTDSIECVYTHTSRVLR